MEHKALLDGQTVRATNVEDTMSMEAFWSEELDKFVVELNGKFMCTSKTFAPALKSWNNLCTKHSLTLTEDAE